MNWAGKMNWMGRKLAGNGVGAVLALMIALACSIFSDKKQFFLENQGADLGPKLSINYISASPHRSDFFMNFASCNKILELWMEKDGSGVLAFPWMLFSGVLAFPGPGKSPQETDREGDFIGLTAEPKEKTDHVIKFGDHQDFVPGHDDFVFDEDEDDDLARFVLTPSAIVQRSCGKGQGEGKWCGGNMVVQYLTNLERGTFSLSYDYASLDLEPVLRGFRLVNPDLSDFTKKFRDMYEAMRGSELVLGQLCRIVHFVKLHVGALHEGAMVSDSWDERYVLPGKSSARGHLSDSDEKPATTPGTPPTREALKNAGRVLPDSDSNGAIPGSVNPNAHLETGGSSSVPESLRELTVVGEQHALDTPANTSLEKAANSAGRVTRPSGGYHNYELEKRMCEEVMEKLTETVHRESGVEYYFKLEHLDLLVNEIKNLGKESRFSFQFSGNGFREKVFDLMLGLSGGASANPQPSTLNPQPAGSALGGPKKRTNFFIACMEVDIDFVLWKRSLVQTVLLMFHNKFSESIEEFRKNHHEELFSQNRDEISLQLSDTETSIPVTSDSIRTGLSLSEENSEAGPNASRSEENYGSEKTCINDKGDTQNTRLEASLTSEIVCETEKTWKLAKIGSVETQLREIYEQLQTQLADRRALKESLSNAQLFPPTKTVMDAVSHRRSLDPSKSDRKMSKENSVRDASAGSGFSGVVSVVRAYDEYVETRWRRGVLKTDYERELHAAAVERVMPVLLRSTSKNPRGETTGLNIEEVRQAASNDKRQADLLEGRTLPGTATVIPEAFDNFELNFDCNFTSLYRKMDRELTLEKKEYSESYGNFRSMVGGFAQSMVFSPWAEKHLLPGAVRLQNQLGEYAYPFFKSIYDELFHLYINFGKAFFGRNLWRNADEFPSGGTTLSRGPSLVSAPENPLHDGPTSTSSLSPHVLSRDGDVTMPPQTGGVSTTHSVSVIQSKNLFDNVLSNYYQIRQKVHEFSEVTTMLHCHSTVLNMLHNLWPEMHVKQLVKISVPQLRTLMKTLSRESESQSLERIAPVKKARKNDHQEMIPEISSQGLKMPRTFPEAVERFISEELVKEVVDHRQGKETKADEAKKHGATGGSAREATGNVLSPSSNEMFVVEWVHTEGGDSVESELDVKVVERARGGSNDSSSTGSSHAAEKGPLVGSRVLTSEERNWIDSIPKLTLLIECDRTFSDVKKNLDPVLEKERVKCEFRLVKNIRSESDLRAANGVSSASPAGKPRTEKVLVEEDEVLQILGKWFLNSRAGEDPASETAQKYDERFLASLKGEGNGLSVKLAPLSTLSSAATSSTSHNKISGRDPHASPEPRKWIDPGSRDPGSPSFGSKSLHRGEVARLDAGWSFDLSTLDVTEAAEPNDVRRIFAAPSVRYDSNRKLSDRLPVCLIA